MEKLPLEGDMMDLPKCTLKIEKLIDNRIEDVRIKLK
jgi:hypothetical protein